MLYDPCLTPPKLRLIRKMSGEGVEEVSVVSYD